MASEDGKKYPDEIQSADFKKDFNEAEKTSSKINRTFSRQRAVLRIFLGFMAMVLWF